MKRRYLLALGATLWLSAPASAQTPEPTGPQPELPKEKLVIVGHDGTQHDFNVEMAISQEQQVTGEMFRTAVPEDGGMLFDWGYPRPSQMWMRNTLVSLDMVFINADGTIRSIAENTTPRSLAIDRQPRTGARDAGTRGRDDRQTGYPGWRYREAADFRQRVVGAVSRFRAG